MSLPLETLRELGKLSDFRKRGVILEQHFEVIKKHVRGGNCLANGDWEAIDLAWKLKGEGVFSEQEWATEIDGQLHAIISARPSLSTQPAAATPSAPSSAPAPLPREKTARPATAAAVNRGKGRMGKATKGTGNIINAFAKGSGKPVTRTRRGVEEQVYYVNFGSPPPSPRLPCRHCHMTFVNEQGLGIHVKTMHSTAKMYKGMRLRRMLGKGDGGRILPWEHAGPGHCWRVTFDHTTGGASFVLQPKRYKDVDL
ncbi:unnamed protein product, partial [Ascophyllum nodosum]